MAANPAATINQKIGDFAKRKTIAAGFLDTALLLANISQMKILLDSDPDLDKGKTIALVVLISISIVLQVMAGILFIWLTHYEHGLATGVYPRKPSPEDLGDGVDPEQWRLDRAVRALYTVNTVVTMTVFIILFMNIVISGLGLSIEKAEKPNLDHLGVKNLTTTT